MGMNKLAMVRSAPRLSGFDHFSTFYEYIYLYQCFFSVLPFSTLVGQKDSIDVYSLQDGHATTPWALATGIAAGVASRHHGWMDLP
jgi:hypothetical protein